MVKLSVVTIAMGATVRPFTYMKMPPEGSKFDQIQVNSIYFWKNQGIQYYSGKFHQIQANSSKFVQIQTIPNSFG